MVSCRHQWKFTVDILRLPILLLWQCEITRSMRQLPCPILVVFHRPFHQTTKKSGHRSMAFYVSCDSWHCKIQTQSSGNESVAYRPTSLRERKILNFSRPLEALEWKFATFGIFSFLIISLSLISFLQFDSTVLTAEFYSKNRGDKFLQLPSDTATSTEKGQELLDQMSAILRTNSASIGGRGRSIYLSP